ncbi:MAG TPA: phosphatase PAP2 family protein [Candidatus Dormibacteraeota bacterium]|nr:phosphatase PAP2 family protein [Candidatus Dormibacteraeota bacterium]
MNTLFKSTLLIAYTATINLVSSIGTPANADVVTDWNNAALDAIRTGNTPPPIASRALAILHTSIYDAVNGIDRRHEAYLVPSAVPASASREAAASAAAHGALVNLFPATTSSFDALHTAILATIPNGPHKTAGIVWGEFVANQILAARANDGSSAVVPPPGGSGPGVWIPTPPAFLPYLLPQWGFVAPFGMNSSSQFRPPGPPSLDSQQYAEDYNEVKELGAAVGSTRTEDQTEIALFWADGAGTETPPGHWNSIAQIIGAAQGTTLEENARLFALLNIAMADAAICSWDAKYTYHFWRPVTAIAFAEPQLNWMSFIVTPPFPDYTSGHSTFSAAAATVLPLFFGTEDLPFTTGSDFLPGVFRSFSTCEDAAEEAALSRIYGGIHFRTASEDGLQAGTSIGEWTFVHYLQPKHNRSRH